MRIALVSQQYPPETARGGIGSQTWLKAHGLAARGHDVHVVSCAADGQRRELLDGAVRVLRIPDGGQRLPLRTAAAQQLVWSGEVAAAVHELHARAPLDLVEFPEYGGEGYVHLLNRTEWERQPAVVVHLHGPLVMLAHTIGWPEPGSELHRVGIAMEEGCLRLADAVYASGACSADWAAERYGLDRARIPVLHAGVDLDRFRPLGSPDPRPTIAFVGHVAASKGADVLVEAALALAGELPDLRLLLVGPGAAGFVGGLAGRAAVAGWPLLVEPLGFIGRAELPAVLARAHLLAVPSRQEGGPGLVYLEAMACGLPAVASSGSGAGEVVVPEVNGLLVPPGDAGALAAALRRLFLDHALHARLAAGALAYVREHADTRRQVARIEEFYGQVLGCRGAGPVPAD